MCGTIVELEGDGSIGTMPFQVVIFRKACYEMVSDHSFHCCAGLAPTPKTPLFTKPPVTAANETVNETNAFEEYQNGYDSL